MDKVGDWGAAEAWQVVAIVIFFLPTPDKTGPSILAPFFPLLLLLQDQFIIDPPC